MPDSMTGFGRAVSDASAGKVIVEIQSVNRKYLEVLVSIPREYSRFEQEVRKQVADRVGRGQVTIRIHLLPNSQAIESFLPDLLVLKGLKKGWEELAVQLGYPASAIDFRFLVEQISLQSQLGFAGEKDGKALQSCVAEALESLVKMKRKEGKALTDDLAQRLRFLRRELTEIRTLSPQAAHRMREKLQARAEEILGQDGELKEKFVREMILFVEKTDISEELTRLESHFSQFEELIEEESLSVGRKMDFMIQEMGREVNTIGAKSADAKISHLIVEMKSDLEKMREQVQNIE